jgi:hypothetical protein
MSNQMNINLDTQVSLREASDLIVSVGASNTFHLVGEPGVGKTAMHKVIADRLGMRAIYIDVPNTELGDLGIPMPDKETGTTKLYPNEHWGFHLDEPLCIILDEITKGSPAVKNMLHPLLTLPRRIGGITLHKDSVVMTAGNLTTDAVGDVMASHTRNRLSVLNVRKPTSEEWLGWGMDVGPTFLAQERREFIAHLDHGMFESNYIQQSHFSLAAGAALRAHLDLFPSDYWGCSFGVNSLVQRSSRWAFDFAMHFGLVQRRGRKPTR